MLLLVGFFIVCVFLVFAAPFWMERQLRANDRQQRATELHAVRRRIDVAWTKHEIRGDAAQLRRELDAELRENV